MKNNLLVYILLCLLNLSWANARNKQQEAEALIKKSVEALYNNPKQASYYAAKVIELFPEDVISIFPSLVNEPVDSIC